MSNQYILRSSILCVSPTETTIRPQKCSNKEKDHPKCNICLFIKYQASSHPPPRTMWLTFSHDVGDNSREPSCSEPYNSIMCLPHRKHLPHLLGFQPSITKTCPNIFIFSLRHDTIQHACLFQFLSHDLHCGVTHTHTSTHTHTHTEYQTSVEN